ncbi:MAG: hypothetical protein PSV35_02035 [bacterium]|nr:hypothetical protein [bacterium]
MTEPSPKTLKEFPILKSDEIMKQSNITTMQQTTADIEHIVKSKKELSQIQQNLDDLLHAMSQNPSMLARAATYWGTIPVWQKVLGGVVLIAPTFVIGIAAQIAVLFALSIFTLITYVSGSVVLDDHHIHNINTTKNLRIGVLNLAEALETVINTLEKISEQLAKHLDEFAQENKKLNVSIKALNNLNKNLAQEIDELKETAKKLHHTEKALQKTCFTLKNSILEQTNLLEETQADLKRVQADYEANQQLLKEKISELDKVNTKLNIDIEQHKKIGQTLQVLVTSLMETMSGDEAQRHAFKEKLDVFVTDKEASFTLIVDRICEAEKELVKVKEQLKQTTSRYDELVNRAEGQIERLEKLPRAKHAMRVAGALNHLGVFTQPQPLESQDITATSISPH